MSKRKDVQPDVNEDRAARDRPQRPEPDGLEGPGQRQESKGEQDAVNKTTRRGER
jgi:hypothetical protein